MLGLYRRHRRIVPEVVQTSAMDCGPASLKAILDGFGISASYGRLREACQTEVDGTSIDTLEDVAVRLGLDAEQVMLPSEHLLLEEARALPALVVVRLPGGTTHFMVVWSCRWGFVQLMDPTTGRLWMRRRTFLKNLYRHSFPIPASSWRAWAGGPEFVLPLQTRIRALGISEQDSDALLDRALDDPDWLPFGALDAAVRMAESLLRSRAMRKGREATVLVKRYFEQVLQTGYDDKIIPGPYWSVQPHEIEGEGEDEEEPHLLLYGAVLIRFLGRQDDPRRLSDYEAARAQEREKEEEKEPQRPLPKDLAAVLEEPPATPGRDLLRMLRKDGVLTPFAIALGLLAGSSTVLLEALLFRGLLDAASYLGLVNQRLAAIIAILVMLTAATLIEVPIAAAILRLGRHLETRLRIAFLEKIPRLADRYFRSRLSSDMAERAHSVHGLRRLPDLGFQLLRSCFLLLLTNLGIIWLDPRTAPVATTVAVISVLLPLASQRFLVERDLRLRTHAGALTRYYLDAMLGLMAIRCHGAERAVRREHETLLVEWSRANISLLRVATVVQAVLTLSGTGLAIWLLMDHLARAGGSGMVLLLIYWVLSLPGLGQGFATAIRQYPSQRNIALRLLEPLGAPDDAGKEAPDDITVDLTMPGVPVPQPGVGITIEDVTVRAGGHTILEDVSLSIEPGHHVAVVGPSGAGKSSLVGLLLGWHWPSSGTLRIDGEPLTSEILQKLRRGTAWIDPAVQLWNRTFIENLRFGTGDRATVPLSEVLERAGLHSVVERLPNGLQTVLGECGGLVSGGEGQRVRLGRGLLRPEVRLAILDEPFRGLDRSQRRSLLVAARQLWSSTTLLCVTHDIGETLAFDRVLVIEHGRLVEDGNPAELRERPDSRYLSLLRAEQAVHEQLWQSSDWRHLRVADASLTERGGES